MGKKKNKPAVEEEKRDSAAPSAGASTGKGKVADLVALADAKKLGTPEAIQAAAEKNDDENKP